MVAVSLKKNFFFKQKTAYEMLSGDWSSDVCSSDLVSAGYLVITETAFNLKMAVYLIALVLLSWLAAMVGYDKVIQSITQFKKGA